MRENTMNIWDSVQRGLEKATHEASRIARTQRLRTTLEGLSKQIEVQHTTIVATTMELFKNGQLTQQELLVLCQELHSLQQQSAQTQSELKLIQHQSNSNTQAVPPTQIVAYPQPSYPPYENTLPALVPPPPPGVEPLTVSSLDTVRAPLMASEIVQCNICQTPLVPGNAFCHHCGTPINTNASYQPTVRGNVSEGKEGEKTILDAAEQATIRGEEASQTMSDTLYDGGN